MKDTTAFWGTTLIWGAFGLLDIYVLTPEYFNDYWLGWFGTMAIMGVIGFAVSIFNQD